MNCTALHSDLHLPNLQRRQTPRPGRAAVLAHANQPQAAQQSSAALDLIASGERTIKLICTDVDGTLMNSSQQLTPGVERALCAAAEAGVPVVVATGKAMGPWVADVLPRLGSRMPQVYLQGLLINCPDSGVLYSRPLEDEVVLQAIRFAAQHGIQLTAYCGADRILCERTDEHSDRLLFYREPTPEAVGPLESQLGQVQVMKLIFMAPHDRIMELRPAVEALFAGQASTTMALKGMLEILPLGASKGAGVSWLLDRLGVAPEHVLALGDGENDVEMLRLAGLGVAVGNAGSKARAAADVVVSSNDEDGVAEAVRRFVLEPRGLAL